MHVTVQRLDRSVSLPAPAHPGDAGLDLPTRKAFEIAPGQRLSVPTGLAVAIPEGYAGLVVARSGHARRSGIGVVNGPGVVDSGYRGELEVILINHGSDVVQFEAGDRIAQLVVVAVSTVEWEEVEHLPVSVRGAAGFGSTGQ